MDVPFEASIIVIYKAQSKCIASSEMCTCSVSSTFANT